MYARITTYNIDPSRESEVLEMLGDIDSQIKALPGIVVCLSSWRSEDGVGVMTAIYESQAAAEASAAAAQTLWGSLAGVMTAPPDSQDYENVRDLLA